ncbi:hypothetical protein GDO86_017075 [Hymenochirus boettgeri]|uniref:Caspase-8 n=1 Tax=Hymenochirus boettgeri TaxID=247094 RepID=A0A8T2INR6_9PIPI|nr:hypothetical protein GDO86_017075 [Hymenochirus boettgeri]
MDEFQRTLLCISQELSKSDVCSLIFLCQDFLPLKNKVIENATEIFILLEENGFLDMHDMFIVKELLFLIHQFKLLKDFFNVSKERMEEEMKYSSKTTISSYRHLLFDLAEEVSEEDLIKIKQLLNCQISRSSMDKVKDIYGMFTEMEKTAILAKDTIEPLKKIFNEIDESLLCKITTYEESYAGNLNIIKLCPCPKPINGFYEMRSKPRGLCLILNNFNFNEARQNIPTLKELKDRRGTKTDLESLREVFLHLHFFVKSFNDLTGKKILQVLKHYSEQNHEKSSAFICCILSHGNKGIVYGTDGQSVAIHDIASYFIRSRCPSLSGKPKVFFIQACQGKEFQGSVSPETDACNCSSVCSETKNKLIPDEPDFLLGMATASSFVSFRHCTQGTWYIQALCKHLKGQCPRGKDLNTILTMVNNEVSQKFDTQHGGTQMPEPCSTLGKKLIFPLH